MKKIMFPCMMILLFLGACSSTSTMQNKTPIYSATIYANNLRVDNIKWISGEKLNLQEGKYELESTTNIFDQNWNKM
ncbi:hypothetical protein BMT55_13520 [Listeria newyorkensis]|uniref:Lipoprotein n=1 Tax=Listeria newyorkensis TaxID=1497681 RepID=A0ABX4XJG7_9LIST|nr:MULTISPECIES: hypothetical protein [Listeria]KGL44935.1 hypothetical protein EP56_05090 [Listeriaceae bacterium FSL A5-0209]KGL40940.1 hypothetical protein EP58_11420 [Listeria newyorkensis]PNP89072.1 hypothetical protein BMT55_13520 [Listeria newyorkensis]RQW68358.1 hypothetical protein DUK53_03020 [Listeria sp. SHR_NRA_18]WAO21374.1 hypothetical protein OTR81_14110 [Listeria newyorkensis]